LAVVVETRAHRGLAALVVATVVIVGALHGWDTSRWRDGEIPTYDVADYLLRAEHFRRALGDGELSAFGRLLLDSDVHPPGLPVALAIWSLFCQPGFAGASVFSAIISTLNLLLTVALAYRCLPTVGGLLAGAAGVAVISASPLHASLFAVPMTEPLSLFWVLSTLALASARESVARDVAVAVAILLGTLTRYNLAPMLLIPVAVVATARALEERRLTPVRVPVLAACTVSAYFGAWYAMNPAMVDGVSRFFRNVDSGIPLVSRANLQWLWDALAGDVAASFPVATFALLGLACAAVRPARTSSRLLVAFTVVALAALLWHRYKLGRNLYSVAPVWIIAASTGLAGVFRERLRDWVGLGLVGLAIPHALSVRGQPAETARYYTEDRHLRHALEAITEAALGSDRVIVAGAHRELSKHLIELWLGAYAPSTNVVFEEQYPPACARRSSQPKLEADCRPWAVLGSLEESQPGGSTSYVVVTSWSPRSSRSDWTALVAADVAAVLPLERYDVATTTLRSVGMQVLIYTRSGRDN